MAVNQKRVFYVNRLAAQTFADALATRPDVRLDKQTNATTDAEYAATLESAHGYQIGASRGELQPRWFGNADLLAKAPNLLVISSNGAGYDTIDVDACTEAGVLAVNQAGGNAEGVAEHALALMLNLTKRIQETDRYMRRQAGIEKNSFMGRNLEQKTVGLIGIGHVGRRVAEMVKVVFKARVLACDPYLSAEEIAARGAEKTDLETLLRESDFVSVHCPRTKETFMLLGAAQFALMKPTAYFVNTARGGIHNEDELADAIEQKKIAGAGLDVWDPEPPEPTNRLLAFDNVIASPHTAGITRESRDNIAHIAGVQMLEILDGKRPPRLLNPEVWPAYRARFERIMGFAPEA
jgi:D-3-phosphoglycerate dehydrogenase